MEAIDDLFADLDNMREEVCINATCVDDLKIVLRRYGEAGVLRLPAINEVERRRRARGCSIPKNFEESVQNAFNTHNEKSRGRARLGQPIYFSTRKDGSDTYWILKSAANRR